jgi:AcrR family transcriptional regulator
MARKGSKLASTPRQPGSRSAVRGRIVAAARHHFLSHGFRGVTMDDLACELGMSKKTLYAHFRQKTDLVKAVMKDKFREAEHDLERITSECSPDVLGALQRLLATMQRHTQEIQPAFLRDIRRDAPELFKLIEARRHRLIQRHFGRLFQAAGQADIIRKDVPVGLVTEILLAATAAIINPQKLADLDLTLEQGFSAIVRVVLEGVITPGEGLQP